MRNLLLFAPIALLPSSALAQDLLVVESTNDTVMLLSGVDGSVINAVFIDLTTSTGSSPSTPIDAIQVGDEYWISDQVADTIFRFDGSGSYLGEYGTGRDNMRGIGNANNNVWATNAGTGGGGYGYALKEYDTSGNLLNVYPTPGETDPFDVLDFGGNLLVADILGEDLDLYDYLGTFLGQFHDGGGAGQINFPEQLAIRASNGNVLAAGFSSPSGIYEYDLTGAQVNFYDTAAQGFTGLRGVEELDNGNLLFTNGSGVHVWDIGTGTVSTIVGSVSGRFITRLAGSDCSSQVYCNPGDGHANNAATIAVSSCTLSGTVTLDLANAPSGQFTYALLGDGNGIISQPPGAKGDLCVTGGSCLGRYAKDVGVISGSGTFSTDISNSISGGPNFGIPTCGGNIQSGETWNFQYWHRQPMGQPSTFSEAISVTFQ